MRSPGRTSDQPKASKEWQSRTTLPFVWTTALGSAVLPEVQTTTRSSAGVTLASASVTRKGTPPSCESSRR